MDLSSFRPLAFVAPLLLGLSTGASSAQAFERLWTTEGFSQPESVLADPARHHLIVSNIDGGAGAADGKGFLSLLSEDGEIETLHWIDGLDAPKGMALVGKRLYVSDLTRLRVFDAETGAPIASHTHPDARFLNDVTADAQGRVYVSDLLEGHIFRLEGEHFAPWLADARIPHPNGLLVEGDRLLIGSWGTGLKEDFSTDRKGGLFEVPLAGGTPEPLPGTEETANVDGIARQGAALVYNDWVTGDIFAWTDGTIHVLATEPSGLADISTAEERIFLPGMMTGTISAVR